MGHGAVEAQPIVMDVGDCAYASDCGRCHWSMADSDA